MHNAIYQAVDLAQPADLQQLVLEWPHPATGDITKIAYTRDDANGIADRQATVSVGKYLTRHFPTLRDNIIRDIAARYVMGNFKFVHTMREMLEVIERGPNSCMGKTADNFRCNGLHPYEAYDPEHGWHMAVYVESDGRYTGRALCNADTFVRTYRASDSTYSSEDDRMRVWLEEQGYQKVSSWEGKRLKYIPMSNDCGFLAPYLDGGDQYVTVEGKTLLITEDGDDAEYECNSQNGDASEVNSRTCEDCGDRIPTDDGYWVNRDEATLVCNSCCDDHYVHAYGRGGNKYYIHSNDAVCVGDEYYHENYISDNNIVCLEDGEYCEMDDAIYIESNSEYYHGDDERICYTVDGEHELKDNCVLLENDEYCLTDDAWQCEHSGDWYANSDCDPVTTACGKSIHEDYADEYATEDEDDTGAQAELFVEQPVVWTPHERGPVETTTKEGE
jgi:hypothetical protein